MELTNFVFSTVTLLLSLYLVIGSTTPLQKKHAGGHINKKPVKQPPVKVVGAHNKKGGKNTPHTKHTDKHIIEQKSHSKCVKLTLPVCHHLKEYDQATYPNLIGHTSQRQARQAMKQFHTYLQDATCRSHLAPFLCLLYAPPCSHLWEPVAPCRKQCEAAQHACSHLMNKGHEASNQPVWPSHLNCLQFPATGGLCLGINATAHHKPKDPTTTHTSLKGFKKHLGPAKSNSHRIVLENRIVPQYHQKVQPPKRSGATVKVTKANIHKHSTNSTSTRKAASKSTSAKKPATKAVRVWQESENMIRNGPALSAQHHIAQKHLLNSVSAPESRHESKKLQRAHPHLTHNSNKIKAHTHRMRQRRYDITDLGDAHLFRGWVDVQGQGAANDYCRVIGSSPKTRFLACALAGTTENYHTYVSSRGFDVGHKQSWFMRDMDGDGRDDYCRCVGHGMSSRISCMKAGKQGFYGSSTQPGSQYTFIVKKAGICIGKTINPVLGLRTL